MTTSRREFLLRAGKAALSIGAIGAVGYAFREDTPPAKRKTPQISLPQFDLPEQAGRMCIANGMDRNKTIPRAFQALGGMESFISKGDRVLIKVNAAFASPPMLGATTHPDTVKTLVDLCLGAGAAEVMITDNPINDPQACFELSGIAEAGHRAGAKVSLPHPGAFAQTTLEGGRLIRNWPLLYAPLQGITKLIGTAPVKDHDRSGASMTMKNWYGLLGGRRNVFHQEINDIIKELALLVRPTLVVLDGTETMMRNGPTGGSVSDLKKTGTLIVSTDQVAADAFGASLLGRQPGELPYIRKAAVAGAGTANYELLNPMRINGT